MLFDLSSRLESNDTIDSVLRHQEVGRAKDLPAPRYVHSISFNLKRNRTAHMYVLCTTSVRSISRSDKQTTTEVKSHVGFFQNRRIRWAGHVARMGEERGCIGSWWGNRREGDHWGDLGVDGWIILGWI